MSRDSAAMFRDIVKDNTLFAEHQKHFIGKFVMTFIFVLNKMMDIL